MEKTPSTESSTNNNRSIGIQFKTAREQRNISLDEAASELCILRRHLDAIERDDYDNLPQMAFTRGFVNSYAKYLKLDVDTTMAVFDANYPVQNKVETKVLKPSETQQLGKLSRNESRKTNFGKLGLLFALFGLLGFGYLYLTNAKKNDASMSEKTSTIEAMQDAEKVDTTDNIIDETANVAEQAKSDSNTTNASTSETAQSQSAQEKNQPGADTNKNLTGEAQTFGADANATTNTAAENNTQVIADPNAKPSELVFWVRRNTDITITDQTGAVIMNGTKQRGEHKASGIPPFKVKINNVQNVALTMDKQRVRVNKYSVDNKADFTLK